MQVAVRVRPLTMLEQAKGYFNIVSVLEEKVVILYDPQEMAAAKGSLYEF